MRMAISLRLATRSFCMEPYANRANFSARAATPDRVVGEESPVAPRVAGGELLHRHVPRAKDHVSRVVLVPVAVQQPILRFHLAKERRAGVRREDVKRRAFEPVALDPTRC